MISSTVSSSKMALMSTFSMIFMLGFHLLVIVAADFHINNNLETYIIHVESPDAQLATGSVDLESWYHSFLPATTARLNKEPRLVYSYRNVFKGFVARLLRK